MVLDSRIHHNNFNEVQLSFDTRVTPKGFLGPTICSLIPLGVHGRQNSFRFSQLEFKGNAMLKVTGYQSSVHLFMLLMDLAFETVMESSCIREQDLSLWHQRTAQVTKYLHLAMASLMAFTVWGRSSHRCKANEGGRS